MGWFSIRTPPSSANWCRKSNAPDGVLRLRKPLRNVPMPLSPPIRPHATGARYETLLEVAESIAAHRKLATLFADLSRCLRSLVSFDFINLTLLDPKANVFRLHILQTDRPIAGHAPSETPYDQSPSGLVLRTRQPYCVPDV